MLGGGLGCSHGALLRQIQLLLPPPFHRHAGVNLAHTEESGTSSHPHTHPSTDTEWVRQPALQQVAHTCVPGLHTRTATPLLIHLQAGMYYICAMSQVCIPGQRDTHTCAHKDRGLTRTHTHTRRARHVLQNESGMHTRSRLCTEGVVTNHIHTRLSVTHTNACVTHAECFSHKHRGVTCAIHTCAAVRRTHGASCVLS